MSASDFRSALEIRPAVPFDAKIFQPDMSGAIPAFQNAQQIALKKRQMEIDQAQQDILNGLEKRGLDIKKQTADTAAAQLTQSANDATAKKAHDDSVSTWNKEKEYNDVAATIVKTAATPEGRKTAYTLLSKLPTKGWWSNTDEAGFNSLLDDPTALNKEQARVAEERVKDFESKVANMNPAQAATATDAFLNTYGSALSSTGRDPQKFKAYAISLAKPVVPKQESDPAKVKEARAYALAKGLTEGTPQYNDTVANYLATGNMSGVTQPLQTPSEKAAASETAVKANDNLSILKTLQKDLESIPGDFDMTTGFKNLWTRAKVAAGITPPTSPEATQVAAKMAFFDRLAKMGFEIGADKLKGATSENDAKRLDTWLGDPANGKVYTRKLLDANVAFYENKLAEQDVAKDLMKGDKVLGIAPMDSAQAASEAGRELRARTFIFTPSGSPLTFGSWRGLPATLDYQKAKGYSNLQMFQLWKQKWDTQERSK